MALPQGAKPTQKQHDFPFRLLSIWGSTRRCCPLWGKFFLPQRILLENSFTDHLSYLSLLKLALSLTITDGSTEPDCFLQSHMTHPVAPGLCLTDLRAFISLRKAAFALFLFFCVCKVKVASSLLFLKFVFWHFHIHVYSDFGCFHSHLPLPPSHPYEPPFLATTPFPTFMYFCFVLWSNEFNQGHLYDHRFGTWQFYERLHHCHQWLPISLNLSVGSSLLGVDEVLELLLYPHPSWAGSLLLSMVAGSHG